MIRKTTIVFSVALTFVVGIVLYTCKYSLLWESPQTIREFVDSRVSQLPQSTPVCPHYQPTNVTTKPSLNIESYASRIFWYELQALENENFTLLMMTYKRANLVRDLLKQYCNLPHLDQVLIVWNDIDSPVPDDLKAIKCSAPIRYIVSDENKLTNRFKPRPEIKTDCIMIIDDDRLIENEDLLFAFRTWQQFRHRIVGFEHRMHVVKDNEYYYGPRKEFGLSPEKLGYSLMITATFIIHYAYLKMFNDPNVFSPEIVKYVDHTMNCEDIAMCLVVGKFLEDMKMPQCAVLSVQAKGGIKNLDSKASGGKYRLSGRSGHTNQRSVCLNKFKEFYSNGRLPLHYTHSRIIPDVSHIISDV